MLLTETAAECVELFFTAPTQWLPWLWAALVAGAALLLLGKKLGVRILGGMVAGGALGTLASANLGAETAVGIITPAGEIFLRLLRMIVIPLVLFSMVSGVQSAAKAGGVGRLAWRTVFYYLVTTTLAVIIGLVLVSVVQPGAGIELPQGCAGTESLPEATTLRAILLSFIPSNPFAAAAAGKVLPMITWGLLLGAGIAAAGAKAQPLADVMNAGFEAIMKVTHWIILLAPYGVMAIVAQTVATRGLDMFAGIGSYMLVVMAGLAIHALVVLPIILTLAKRNMYRYGLTLSPALMNAFSTASSSATLPLTMEHVEKAGVSRRTSRFLLPLGATINMDGTALYEAVAVVFIAQVYGVELSLGALILVALTATLASIGAAGIPEAGLVTMAMVLTAVGLPLEGVGMILGVDWFLDRCRTTVNVWGDAVGAAVVDKLESG